jgi:biotin transport system substrate-specific component
VFCVLVLAGLPLLSGGRGGLGILAGPTGGFFVGFAVGAFAVGWLVERFWQRMSLVGFFAATSLGGIGVVYLIGIPWLALAADLTLVQAAAGSAAFIPGDLIKAAVAAGIADVVRRGYPVIGRAG